MHYSTKLELVLNIFWVIVGSLYFLLLYKTLKSYSLYVNFFFFFDFFPMYPPFPNTSQNPINLITIILAFFFIFFPLQKDFDICFEPFFGIFNFLLQKYFNIIHVLLFEASLSFLDNIHLPFLYIQKKTIKNFLLVTLVLFSISFIRIFFIRIFLSESDEISIL